MVPWISAHNFMASNSIVVEIFQSLLKGPTKAVTRTRKGKQTCSHKTTNCMHCSCSHLGYQHFLFEKAKDKHIVVPDILSILQHGQTDGALLIGVQLLIIQTHLQVLGYSLQRDLVIVVWSEAGWCFFFVLFFVPRHLWANPDKKDGVI